VSNKKHLSVPNSEKAQSEHPITDEILTKAEMKSKEMLILDYECFFSFYKEFLHAYFPEINFYTHCTESIDVVIDTLENNGNIELLHLDKSRFYFSDYNLMDVTKEIKAKYPYLNIMFVSSWNVNDDLEELINERIIYGYIRKPFKVKEYSKIISNFLEL
jgi:DNA-binding NtrC family response regulator